MLVVNISFSCCSEQSISAIFEQDVHFILLLFLCLTLVRYFIVLQSYNAHVLRYTQNSCLFYIFKKIKFIAGNRLVIIINRLQWFANLMLFYPSSVKKEVKLTWLSSINSSTFTSVFVWDNSFPPVNMFTNYLVNNNELNLHRLIISDNYLVNFYWIFAYYSCTSSIDCLPNYWTFFYNVSKGFILFNRLCVLYTTIP